MPEQLKYALINPDENFPYIFSFSQQSPAGIIINVCVSKLHIFPRFRAVTIGNRYRNLTIGLSPKMVACESPNMVADLSPKMVADNFFHPHGVVDKFFAINSIE